METANIIFLLIGIIIFFFGIVAFFNPNWARWINFPGGPRLKAIAALLGGAIFIIIGFFIEIPTN
ncbi:MAG: hypothetical protein KKC68_01280 [Candidatus Thermoplasmatota archaeon]|nr:hypothetical protein [Candidatus Thermoplasmatota archaeon]MBU1940383.1 hypothetical protein [Candidatus Thermoplasmatota archaeon]